MSDRGQELLALGAATVHEARGQRGWLGPSPAPLWAGARLAGRCRTVWAAPGDNLAVHRALESAQPGDILCVATGGVRTHGIWGDVLMHAARARGVRGLVTSGGVRDLAELAAAAFPVFAHGVATQGTVKRDPGRHGVPVVLGAGVVTPGDWVVADADGVVVVPEAELDAVLAAGHRRTASERRAVEAIAGGATSLEALGLEVGADTLTSGWGQSGGDARGRPERR